MKSCLCDPSGMLLAMRTILEAGWLWWCSHASIAIWEVPFSWAIGLGFEGFA